jgi:hypothetical protein
MSRNPRKTGNPRRLRSLGKMPQTIPKLTPNPRRRSPTTVRRNPKTLHKTNRKNQLPSPLRPLNNSTITSPQKRVEKRIERKGRDGVVHLKCSSRHEECPDQPAAADSSHNGFRLVRFGQRTRASFLSLFFFFLLRFCGFAAKLHQERRKRGMKRGEESKRRLVSYREYRKEESC